MKSFFSNNVLPIIIVFSLVACTPSKTSEEYLASANSYVEKGENSAAVIELKNAINNGFNNYQVRQLLGDIYLNQGLAAAAEKEFRTVIKLGGDENIVLPGLLKSLNILGKHKDILDIIDNAGRVSNEVLPIVKLYSAIAYQNLGDIEQAKNAVSEANDISEHSVYSRLGDAYLKGNNNNNKALDVLGSIIKEDPFILEAYLLQGQLYFVEGDYSKSIESFENYQNLAPQDFKIKLFLANSFLNNKQFKEADKEVDYILGINPHHAFSNQLKGIISYQQADYYQAFLFTEKAIQNGINSTPNKIIAGLSAFQQKNYESAYKYLSGVQKELPLTHPVIKVLAMVHMALGYEEKALDVLGNIEVITPEDAKLFTSASFELLKSGNIKGAKSMLLKADSLEDNSAAGAVRIGVLKLSLNDLEGITDLERAIDLDADLPMAKLTLISAYINNNEFDKAISIAKKWKAQDSNKVVGYNLLAKIYFVQKDIINAELELSEALKVAPENQYSLLYFSNKALAENKLDLAYSKISILIKKYPRHLKGLSLLYAIQQKRNRSDIALSQVKQAFEQSNGDIEYRILYAKTLLKEKAYQQVVDVLLPLPEDEGTPTPVIVWALLGKGYEKLNQFEVASEVYDNWIKNNPDSRYAYQKKVAVQESMKDYTGAQSTVEKVLRKVPEDVEFTIMLAYFQQKNGFAQTAQRTINTLPENTKNMIIVKEVQGLIFFNDNKFVEALPNLIEVYNNSPTAPNMSYVYSAYIQTSQKDQAIRFLKAHVNANQQELYGKTFLAERSMGVDNNLAKRLFGELLVEKPKDGALLNNIAWVELQLGNLTVAEAHVNNALQILTEHPKVLDTLGLIKLKQGQKEGAIQVFEKALLLAPNDTEIKQHLIDAQK